MLPIGLCVLSILEYSCDVRAHPGPHTLAALALVSCECRAGRAGGIGLSLALAPPSAGARARAREACVHACVLLLRETERYV